MLNGINVIDEQKSVRIEFEKLGRLNLELATGGVL